MPDWPNITTTSVSGQPVGLTSGTLVTNQSGLNVIIQSGAFVVGTVTANTSGQGVIIQSGAFVNVGSGLGVVTSVSGNYVSMSGVTAQMNSGLALFVQMSGVSTTLSGVYVNIGSGVGVTAALAWASSNMVSVGSGIAYQMSGANVVASVSVGSGLYIVMSGQGLFVDKASLSGLFVTAGVNINSGLYITMSGQGVTINSQSGVSTILQSGTQVRIDSISGLGAVIASGLFVYQSPATQSGQYIIISGQGVSVQSGIFVNIGSGIGVTAAVSISSGLYVQISGQGVTTSIASGLFVYQSPATQSGQRVIINSQSGLPVTLQPAVGIRTRLPLLVSDVSGGTALISGIVRAVTIKVHSGQILIGGNSSIDMPYYGGLLSSVGFLVEPGEAVTLPVENFNLLKVVAATSGGLISYIGTTQ
jgi:hypothetical protein